MQRDARSVTGGMTLPAERAQRLQHRDQRLLNHVVDLGVPRAKHTIDHTRKRWPHSIEEAARGRRIPTAGQPCQRRQLGGIILARRGGRGVGGHDQGHSIMECASASRSDHCSPQNTDRADDFFVRGFLPPKVQRNFNAGRAWRCSLARTARYAAPNTAITKPNTALLLPRSFIDDPSSTKINAGRITASRARDESCAPMNTPGTLPTKIEAVSAS